MTPCGYENQPLSPEALCPTDGRPLVSAGGLSGVPVSRSKRNCYREGDHKSLCSVAWCGAPRGRRARSCKVASAAATPQPAMQGACAAASLRAYAGRTCAQQAPKATTHRGQSPEIETTLADHHHVDATRWLIISHVWNGAETSDSPAITCLNVARPLSSSPSNPLQWPPCSSRLLLLSPPRQLPMRFRSTPRR